MALQRMIVSGDPSENEFPYQFHAKKAKEEDEKDKEKTYVINIVMPLGGKENGLFRYPKTGEAILVDDDGMPSPKYYLLGYLPSSTEARNNFLTNVDGQNDSEKEDLKKEEGLILRYEQTGKVSPKKGDDRYSEIAFYKKQTQWPSSDASYKGPIIPKRYENEKNEDYSQRLVKAGFSKSSEENDEDHIMRVCGERRPFIDRINIRSSGDLYAGAKNHQRLTANRFELLAGCNTDHTKYIKAKLLKDDLPLGDNVGDDPVLHAGDAHIRAKNRVVIKAGKEIILQVGKTALKISDNSLGIISKIINSNAANSFDATVNVSKDGVSMFGQDVNISSFKSFGIGDAFGGSVGGRLGVVSIGGREIKADTYDKTQYIVLTLVALAQYIQNIAAASGAVKKGEEDKREGDLGPSDITKYTKFCVKLLKDIYSLGMSIKGLYNKWDKFLTETAREAAKEANAEAIEKARYAEAEANKKKAEIEARKDAEVAKANEEMKAEFARIAEMERKNEITVEKATEMAMETTQKTQEKILDIENKAEEEKIDVDLEKERTIIEGDEAENRQAMVDEAGDVKKDIDKQAKEKNEAADREAERKKDEINQKVANGELTREEAGKQRAAVDREAEETKKEVYKETEEAKEWVDNEVRDKGTSSFRNEETRMIQKGNEARQAKNALRTPPAPTPTTTP
jgi:hypothetical protein